ncbi:MAG TPA: peptide chain release factor N(5)-glutamine methyltransferase [Candidatus Anaerotignum merdipullorum]|nr:peptide chain release factor N(5)-glutamine methyltransferase [Candidatus Anaerotignum merdipullorum]
MSRNDTIGWWLREGTERLMRAKKDNARREAAMLLQKATGLTQTILLTESEQKIKPEAARKYVAFLNERENGRPLQYILGEWEFMGLSFSVGEGVLIPRADTEVLVETILEMAQKERLHTGLDIGTGTGCIPICLEKLGGIQMTAVELHTDALAFAKRNNDRNRTHVTFVESDLFANLPENMAPLDFIVSNPPYIPQADCDKLMPEVRFFEPRSALDGGADGLDVYRAIIAQAGTYLRDGGWLFFEIGYDQREALFTLMQAAGFVSVVCRQDLAGLDRVVYGKKGCRDV